jgi:hypothetical protein
MIHFVKFMMHKIESVRGKMCNFAADLIDEDSFLG